jgi:phenylacetate-CoA ligase
MSKSSLPDCTEVEGGRSQAIVADLLRAMPAYFACLVFSLAMKVVRVRFSVWRWAARHYVAALEPAARVQARLLCSYARWAVPAYRHFLRTRRMLHPAARFPETNKQNYANAYDFASRCKRGLIEPQGTSIDESSGATGTPFNWLRSAAELRDTSRNIGNYLRLTFPSKKLLTINAFSMGAWATGLTVTGSAARVGIVKSIGPDIAAIEATLLRFGPSFDYLVTGYPPFLKHLCDALDAKGFAWDRYRVFAMVGGEPITEALRQYLERRFLKVRSGYGASDLQIAMAGETDFTVWLRKLIVADTGLRHRLLGVGEDRIPMVFQYNPFEHYIETNDQGELVVTIANLAVMCPKLRYNVGDEGRILAFPDVIKALGPPWEETFPVGSRLRREILRLPVLFLFGRKDSTISYMGANIHPQDVEYGLYADANSAQLIESFFLGIEQRDNLETIPTINVQLRHGCDVTGDKADLLAGALRTAIVDHLSRVSRDFAQSLREDPTAANLQLHLFPHGSGPFAAQLRTIKNRYLVRA